MSNFIQNKAFYNRVKNYSTRREAWHFFLRRNMRAKGFCNRADHDRMVEERRQKAEDLEIIFEQKFGSFYK